MTRDPTSVDEPTIAVVVATFRRPGLLARCLDALCAQTFDAARYEIVVADDEAGQDGARRTYALVARYRASTDGAPDIRYVPVTRTQGPAGARNAGWRTSRARVVAFTDDDTIPDRDWLAAGLAALDSGHDAVGGAIAMPLPATPTDYERDAAGLSRAEFATANCFVERAALAAVGGFDERFTRAWREDSDLQFSLLAAGYRVGRAPDALVVHPVRPAPFGVSVGQQRKAAFDALLFRKHRAQYRARIDRSPPWSYVCVLVLLLAVIAVCAGAWLLFAFSGAVWLVLTIRFALRRLVGTSHRPSHVFEMLTTSMVIPPVAIGWRLIGALRFRVAFLWSATGRYLVDHRPRRIAVFRALVLGDLLCSVPALRALRVTCPDARIVLVGLPSMRDFVDRYPHYIDELVAFPGAPGFPEQPEQADGLTGFIEAMRARRFDLAMQMHGSGGIANDLVRRFGAATTAGFRQPDEQADGHFVDWDAEPSEVRRYLGLVRALGGDALAVDDPSLELPIRPREFDEWYVLRRRHGLEYDGFVCIHPGARWPSRRWPLERFVQVACDRAAQGSRIVLTGSNDEAPLVDALRAALERRGVTAVDLAGRTSLGALAAMLRETRLLISNDTGISHVAAAMGTPSVVIASGSDVVRWAPLDTRLHRVLAHQVACRPCMFRDCPIDHPCATGIGVDAVIAAASQQEEIHHAA